MVEEARWWVEKNHKRVVKLIIQLWRFRWESAIGSNRAHPNGHSHLQGFDRYRFVELHSMVSLDKAPPLGLVMFVCSSNFLDKFLMSQACQKKAFFWGSIRSMDFKPEQILFPFSFLLCFFPPLLMTKKSLVNSMHYEFNSLIKFSSSLRKILYKCPSDISQLISHVATISKYSHIIFRLCWVVEAPRLTGKRN